jgi:hypothetical protein
MVRSVNDVEHCIFGDQVEPFQPKNRTPGGKTRSPYEFGVKASITTTYNAPHVIDACPMLGNP